MMVEHRFDQHCLFLWGDYRNRDHKSKVTFLGSSPHEDVFWTLETNDGRI
jgi:hypothetical protein